MKIASMIARYLLGLMFTVIGLNGFLHFILQPPPANPTAQVAAPLAAVFETKWTDHPTPFAVFEGRAPQIVISGDLSYPLILSAEL
jgi:hypothetical protein